MFEQLKKSSLMPSNKDESIAFVCHDSPERNNPTYKIKTGRIEDSTESITEIAKIVRAIRGNIRFLSEREIYDRFGMQSISYMRPFTDEEKRQALSLKDDTR